MNLFALLPYFWLLLLVGSVIAAIVVPLLGRPKKPKQKKEPAAVADPLADQPSLDFGDELAQMEKP